MNSVKKLVTLAKLVHSEAGQAMVEYSIVAHLLIGAGGLMLLKFLPKLISTYQMYLDGFYFTLNLPLP